MEENKDNKIIELLNFIKQHIEDTSFRGKVYLAGESVRNWLLGAPITNVELAVNLPIGGSRLANILTFDNGCIENGKNPSISPQSNDSTFFLKNSDIFGDIKILARATKIKNSNIFGSIDEDVKRYDLSIDSLYYNITTNSFLDPTGKGLKDIDDKILRCASPSIVFSSEPIKVLRFIRLSSEFNFGIEKETWLSMIQNADNILNASQIQITLEIAHLLLTDKPSVGFKRIAACNHLLNDILPSINSERLIMEDVDTTLFKHTMDVVDRVKPRLANRFAALFHDIAKTTECTTKYSQKSSEMAKAIFENMHLPSNIALSASLAIALHSMFSWYTDKEVPRKSLLKSFKSFAKDDMDVILDLMEANNICRKYCPKPNQVKRIRKRLEEIEAKEKQQVIVQKLPINGNDIINKFSLKSGPEIGKILKKVRKECETNPTMSKDDCLAYVSCLINK